VQIGTASRLALLGVALAAAVCADAANPSDSTTDSGLSIVATTSILGDLVANIVGVNGTVEVLLPIGADPHDYQASARQVAAIQVADLVVANGLALEEGLAGVLESAKADGANVLELAPQLDPAPLGTGRDAPDPHVWLDPVRMADAARLISDRLTALDPTIDWTALADTYAAELLDADQRIREILSTIPDEHRSLVTSHDSLGYFAERYDFEIVGVVIAGGSTLVDPSSSDMSTLVQTINAAEIQAIFTDSTGATGLAEALAAEAEAVVVVVVELHTGSLGGPGSGAETLIDMLTTNAIRIAAALGGS